MLHPNRPRIVCCLLALSCLPWPTMAQQNRLSSIPRVDVHAHVGRDPQVMDRYLEIARVLKDEHDTNLDIWVDLGSYRRPKKLDLAARIGWFGFLDRDKIRAFIIKYSDRILFGTDISEQIIKEEPTVTARRYRRCFQILETDETVPAGFFPPPGEGRKAVEGLALPMEVLEAVYYKNAVRLYPGVGIRWSVWGIRFSRVPSRRDPTIVASEMHLVCRSLTEYHYAPCKKVFKRSS